MTFPEGKENKIRTPPYKLAGLGAVIIVLLILVVVFFQFRGSFEAKTELKLISARAGLVMDPGSKVTYNGVEIGKVGEISETTRDKKPAALFTLQVKPKYLSLIPANVQAEIKATTVFGGKYVALSTPPHPVGHLDPKKEIDARKPSSCPPPPGSDEYPPKPDCVTTEINTVFETITAIAQHVDPVKLNLTLAGAADALNGLGDKLGQSIINANAILDDVNPQQPRVRRDIQQLAALGDTYANAAPDLVDFLNNADVTARTVYRQRNDLDAALLAAVGFGNTGADVIGRGGPYLVRGAADLKTTAQLLDTYSPEIYCTIRKYHDVEPAIAAGVGGSNGYSLRTDTELLSGAGLAIGPGLVPLLLSQVGGLVGLVGGAPNPYVYPENLPRVNSRGGPGGAPGCWQQITHDFWPAPYLVLDDGASLAPYNHLDTGSPYAIEYVWGRQVGDNTINP